MEIDITFLTDPNKHDLMDYSASCAELGQDAGKITWNNCLEANMLFLETYEDWQEAKEYFKSFGAWTSEEIENWNDKELNALILQDIAGTLREYLKAKEYLSDNANDWQQWLENNGGRIYEEDNGKFYFYLGN